MLAASVPGSLQRKNSMAHADILNFVAKQQNKSIAFKELLRHLIFTVVSFPSQVFYPKLAVFYLIIYIYF
jgi:hypothetical protein